MGNVRGLDLVFEKHGVAVKDQRALQAHLSTEPPVGYSGVLSLYNAIPDIFPELVGARRDIANVLIDACYRAVQHQEIEQGDLIELGIMNKGMAISRMIIDVLNEIEKLDELIPHPLNVKWIKDNTSCFDRLNAICEGDWEFVAALMPDEMLLEPEKEYRKPIDDEALRDKITSLKDVAEKLGGNVLAQFLVSLNLVGNHTMETLNHLITSHLGECAGDPMKFTDIDVLPIDMLRDPNVYRVVFIHLRDEMYRMFEEEVILGGQEDQEFKLSLILTYAKRFFNMKDPIHSNMYKELEEYWNEVIHITSGERMEDTTENEKKEKCPFPSLLQKVSMHEMISEGRQLNASTMGRGKSACPFLTWERLREMGKLEEGEKLVFVCEPDMVPKLKLRVAKYYKEGSQPSVGTITSNTKNKSDAIHRGLAADIIIVADTMLGGSRTDKAGNEVGILDALVDANIGYIAIDEAHRARTKESKRAENLQRLCNERSERLKYLQLLTASPLPNRTKDALTYLKLLYPEEYSHVDRVGNIDPLRLRNTLLKCLINLDPPDLWRDELEMVLYSLSPEEKGMYEFIRGIRNLTPGRKLMALRQFNLNPALHTEGVENHALFDNVVAELRKDLDEAGTVHIVHSSLTDGFTRDTKDRGIATWVDKLKAEFGDDVEICVVDGGTSTSSSRVAGRSEKEAILQDGPKDGKKKIVLVNGETVRTGRSLVHVKMIYFIDCGFNDPENHQLARRYNRAGNDDSTIKAFVGQSTIIEVITKLAILKAKLTSLALYGGNLTKQHMKGLEKLDMNPDEYDVDYSNQAMLIGSLLLEYLLVGGAYTDRFQRNFHLKGEEVFLETLRELGEAVAYRMQEDYPYSYNGNNTRFIASLVSRLEEGGVLQAPEGESLRYVNMYAEMGALGSLLETAKKGVDRDVHEIEPNEHLVAYGRRLKEDLGMGQLADNISQGGFADIAKFDDESLDMCHVNLGFNILHNAEKRTFIHLLHAKLKQGGVGIFTLPSYVGANSERKRFLKVLQAHGFEVLEDYTGVGSAGKKNEYFENYTIAIRKVGVLPGKKIHANEFQLSIHDRATGAAKSRQEGLYTFHNEFEIENASGNVTTCAIDLENTQEHAEMNMIEGLRAYLERSLRGGMKPTEVEIPPAFVRLQARIEQVQGVYYMGIPRGGKFITLALEPAEA